MKYFRMPIKTALQIRFFCASHKLIKFISPSLWHKPRTVERTTFIQVNFKFSVDSTMGEARYEIRNELTNSSSGDGNSYEVNNKYGCTGIICEKWVEHHHFEHFKNYVFFCSASTTINYILNFPRIYLIVGLGFITILIFITSIVIIIYLRKANKNLDLIVKHTEVAYFNRTEMALPQVE